MFIINTGETKLIAALKQVAKVYSKELTSDVIDNALVKPLNIGDAMIKDNTTDKPVIVIERKEVKDYVRSIIDGRNHEQMERMKSSGLKVIYIVEGSLELLPEKEIKMIDTSMINKTVQHDCYIIRTTMIVDTMKKIIDIDDSYHKMKKDGNMSSYESAITTAKLNEKKSKNVTPRLCFIKILCCIPGISKKTCDKILSVCDSLSGLAEAIENGKLINVIGKSKVDAINTYLFV